MEVTSVPCGPTYPMIPHMGRVSFLFCCVVVVKKPINQGSRKRRRYTYREQTSAIDCLPGRFTSPAGTIKRPLHHQWRFVPSVTVWVCAPPSQGSEVPWRLPADSPNSPHLVNRGSSYSP